MEAGQDLTGGGISSGEKGQRRENSDGACSTADPLAGEVPRLQRVCNGS